MCYIARHRLGLKVSAVQLSNPTVHEGDTLNLLPLSAGHSLECYSGITRPPSINKETNNFLNITVFFTSLTCSELAKSWFGMSEEDFKITGG